MPKIVDLSYTEYTAQEFADACRSGAFEDDEQPAGKRCRFEFVIRGCETPGDYLAELPLNHKLVAVRVYLAPKDSTDFDFFG